MSFVWNSEDSAQGKGYWRWLVIGVIGLLSSAAVATPISANFAAVTGSLATGYMIEVPTLGHLRLSYATSTTGRSGYNVPNRFPFDNFTVSTKDSVADVVVVEAVDFALYSIRFELWDLDNNDEVTFQPTGETLTGSPTPIPQNQSNTQGVQYSSLFSPDGSGQAWAYSGTSANAWFAIGGIQVEGAPVPVPPTTILMGLGLAALGWMRRRRPV